MSKQKVINFFAGPGAGKSTMATRLQSELKYREHNSEISYEYVKEGEWEGRTGKIRDNQDYIFGKQHFRMRRLEGEVEYIVTDSPIILGIAYSDPDYIPALEQVIIQAYSRFDNLNFFVNRSKNYLQKGRSQTREEAVDKDNEIRAILDKHAIPFIDIEYSPWHAEVAVPRWMSSIGWEVKMNPFEHSLDYFTRGYEQHHGGTKEVDGTKRILE